MEVMRTRPHPLRPGARPAAFAAIHYGHALGNTLVPVVTIVALHFGGVIAFSIVTESVFQWPGLGLHLPRIDPLPSTSR